jgi:PIN domain nuclease of toxin-antitoxin system
MNFLSATHIVLSDDKRLTKETHVISLENLPALHSDPFDRLLVAQASAESLKLLTHDSIVAKYVSAVKLV